MVRIGSHLAPVACTLGVVLAGFSCLSLPHSDQIATRKAAERRLQRTKDRDAAFEKAPMEMKVRFVQMEESLKRQLET